MEVLELFGRAAAAAISVLCSAPAIFLLLLIFPPKRVTGNLCTWADAKPSERYIGGISNFSGCSEISAVLYRRQCCKDKFTAPAEADVNPLQCRQLPTEDPDWYLEYMWTLTDLSQLVLFPQYDVRHNTCETNNSKE